MVSITKSQVLRIYAILAVIALFSIVFGALTHRSPCVFYGVTGIPCPSCGMTRAWLALLQGQIERAFFYHPLFLLIPVIPLMLWYKKTARFMFLGMMFIIFVTWFVRLALYFPNMEPMRFHAQAVIPSVIHFIATYH